MTDEAAGSRASIVVVTRDRPDQLRLLLQSLTKQTRTPDEVVIVDNDSSTSYEAVFADFACRLPLRTFVEKELGPAAARNRGFREARGDLILFIDDDCEAMPDWVEKIVGAFDRNPHIGEVGGRIQDGGRLQSMLEQFVGWDRLVDSPPPARRS